MYKIYIYSICEDVQMEPAVRMVHVLLKQSQQSQHDVKRGLDVRMENVFRVFLPLFSNMKPSLNDFRTIRFVYSYSKSLKIIRCLLHRIN